MPTSTTNLRQFSHPDIISPQVFKVNVLASWCEEEENKRQDIFVNTIYWKKYWEQLTTLTSLWPVTCTGPRWVGYSSLTNSWLVYPMGMIIQEQRCPTLTTCICKTLSNFTMIYLRLISDHICKPSWKFHVWTCMNHLLNICLSISELVWIIPLSPFLNLCCFSDL